MEVSGGVIILLIVLLVVVLILIGSIHDCSYYKGHAEAYERMLIKAGLIDEPVVTAKEEEGPDE